MPAELPVACTGRFAKAVIGISAEVPVQQELQAL